MCHDICGFDLHFLDGWYWVSFHVFVDHLYVFFGKFIHVLWLFFSWVGFWCWVVCVLCIFWILAFYQIFIICKYLLPCSEWPFCFVNSFLCCGTGFLVWCSPICLFCFCSHVSEGISEKYFCQDQLSKILLPIFPSRNLTS